MPSYNPRQCEFCSPCQKAMPSYSINETGAEARIDNRALGQSPEAYCMGLCPGMEVLVPAGARLFNQSINKSHNSGEDIKQELLHKATSFMENCPSNFIALESAHFNSAVRGLFFVFSRQTESMAKNGRIPKDIKLKKPPREQGPNKVRFRNEIYKCIISVRRKKGGDDGLVQII